MADRQLNNIARRSAQQQFALIGELRDSLSDADVPLTQAQKAELERRSANF